MPLTAPHTSLSLPMPPPKGAESRLKTPSSTPATSANANTTDCAQVYPSKNNSSALSARVISLPPRPAHTRTDAYP